MSYIRSGSNPEGLYIYCGGNGVNICMPYSEITHVIEPELFDGLIALYNKRGCRERISFGSLSLEEKMHKDGNRVHLKGDGFEVVMWPVTWHYIAS